MLLQPECVSPHGTTAEDGIAGCNRGKGTNRGGRASPTLDNTWAQALTEGVEVCVDQD
jgi:hypothetical protein